MDRSLQGIGAFVDDDCWKRRAKKRMSELGLGFLGIRIRKLNQEREKETTRLTNHQAARKEILHAARNLG